MPLNEGQVGVVLMRLELRILALETELQQTRAMVDSQREATKVADKEASSLDQRLAAASDEIAELKRQNERLLQAMATGATAVRPTDD